MTKGGEDGAGAAEEEGQDIVTVGEERAGEF